MKSLKKTYDLNEVLEFIHKVNDLPVGGTDHQPAKLTSDSNIEIIVVQPKIDGVSLQLTYRSGWLTEATTKGRMGDITDIVTTNLNCIPTLISHHDLIGEELIVRGELYLDKEDFLDLNNKRKAEGTFTFKNARNVVTGTLRLKSVREARQRKVKFKVFDVIKSPLRLDRTIHPCELTYTCHSFGFNPISQLQPPLQTYTIEFLENLETMREEFSMQIDGLVFKVTSRDLRSELGETAKYPKWAIAYKFPPEQGIATVERIEYQEGKKGNITPVAIFKESLILAGNTVSRVSLHNENFRRDYGVKVGTRIKVSMMGDTIPQFKGVV